MKAEDLTGRRFGKLLVTGLYDEEYNSRGRIRRLWQCNCACGNKCIVEGDYLRRGQRTTCGKCKAPPWADAKNRLCRRCEWSVWSEKRGDWDCTHGWDSSLAKNKCDGYWCSSVDKLTGIKNRSSKCIICGKPTYAYKKEAPIYCYEHRIHAAQDRYVIDNMPTELLFCLIQGIFERARIDYLTNEDNQRSDAEAFLKSPWAQALSLSYFDAEEALKQMDEEILYGFERDREDTW